MVKEWRQFPTCQGSAKIIFEGSKHSFRTQINDSLLEYTEGKGIGWFSFMCLKLSPVLFFDVDSWGVKEIRLSTGKDDVAGVEGISVEKRMIIKLNTLKATLHFPSRINPIQYSVSSRLDGN